MLTITNACKSLNNQIIFDRLNLTVDKQTILGLAGHSGCGKSTLLRCIQGLDVLDSGMINYAGKCCYMFQDFQLFPHMTVIKNLIYAPKLQDKNTDHQPHALALLTQLGLTNKAESYPNQLSGGQKQRVALARSLMMQPHLLLCDEPTSGLDLAAIDDVIELLISVKKMGIAMIIVSHDLTFLTQIADRIVVLKKGNIIADIKPKFLENSLEQLKQYYED